jgi:hypothetical protein
MAADKRKQVDTGAAKHSNDGQFKKEDDAGPRPVDRRSARERAERLNWWLRVTAIVSVVAVILSYAAIIACHALRDGSHTTHGRRSDTGRHLRGGDMQPRTPDRLRWHVVDVGRLPAQNRRTKASNAGYAEQGDGETRWSGQMKL